MHVAIQSEENTKNHVIKFINTIEDRSCGVNGIKVNRIIGQQVRRGRFSILAKENETVAVGLSL